jgi:glutathione S-transferase
MTLRFYTLSGSPFGWKVQLALEFKGVPYDLTILSSDKGDLNSPWFRALNPHGKLPVIVDGDFVLYESDAILAYIEDAYPQFGAPLWPVDLKARATARRMSLEVSSYLYPPVRALVKAWAGPPDASSDAQSMAASKALIAKELEIYTPLLKDSFFNGALPGAVDFTLFPLTAILKRLEMRKPGHGLESLMPDEMKQWRERIEALPAYGPTYPQHWSTQK